MDGGGDPSNSYTPIFHPFGAPHPHPHHPQLGSLGGNPPDMLMQGFAPFLPTITGWAPPQSSTTVPSSSSSSSKALNAHHHHPHPHHHPPLPAASAAAGAGARARNAGAGDRRYSLFQEKPARPAIPMERRYSLRTEVHDHIDEPGEPGSSSSTVAIDNKIEQAMDLVKSHLMYAVREEVEVLKEQIKELLERLAKLEHENKVLRSEASPDTLSKLPAPLPPIQNPVLQQLMALHNPSSSTSSSS